MAEENVRGEPFEVGQSDGIVAQMPDIGRLMVVAGLLIAGMGVVLWTGFGRGWLGQLPGDVNYQRGNFSFHFPIVTCVLASAILTFLMWLFRR